MKKINKKEFRQTIDTILTDLVHEMPSELKNYINEHLKEDVFPYFLGNFRFTLILDTNILFKAVRYTILKSAPSLLEKLANNPLIRICGPVHLAQEIMEKIEKKFPRDKQTQHIPIEQAKHIAKCLLSRVEIIDKQSNKSIKKAQAELSTRDTDDIPFLALAFQENASGVLTADKDYESSSIKMWKVGEAGEVVTILSKGSLSFIVAAKSTEVLIKLGIEIVTFLWTKIIQMASQIIDVIKSGIKTAVDNPWISILVCLGLILLDKATGCIRKIAKSLVEIFNSIGEALWEIMQFLAEIAGVGIDIYGILLENHHLACNTINTLQKLQPEYN